MSKEAAMKFKFGTVLEDQITGFSGINTGFARYITGCDQYLVTPKIDGEGKHVESRWFDANRLKTGLQGQEAIHLDLNEEDDRGACEPAPIK